MVGFLEIWFSSLNVEPLFKAVFVLLIGSLLHVIMSKGVHIVACALVPA